MILKSLPGYGNSELKIEDMKPCDNSPIRILLRISIMG